ncbi:MAG: MBL fold metallo-hydrolase [Nevskiaceae bacterium]|nr:MAG: MBL fold metallo-hydrolase [Nevskiaceae bacterium]TBR72003.1 MAG: MBL fold metallo-hydrolase [Nevskiaceae bacterium]
MAENLRFEIIPVTAFEQNCSLVWDADTQRGALIDAGGEIDRLLERVAAHGVTLEKLLVTHGHIDHVGGVAALAEKLGLPVEGPQEEDKFWIDLLPMQSQRFGFPPAQTFTPTRWLHDGDRVTVGGLHFDVFHCPGHTPGHVVLLHRPSQLAFVGDVIFQGSIGRSDFPRGNHADLVHSIREKLFPLGDAIRFVPGHGPMSNFGHERRTNPFVSDSAFG